jgi:hypothetical protein
MGRLQKIESEGHDLRLNENSAMSARSLSMFMDFL